MDSRPPDLVVPGLEITPMTSTPDDDGFTLVTSKRTKKLRRNNDAARTKPNRKQSAENGTAGLETTRTGDADPSQEAESPNSKSQRRGKLLKKAISVEEAAALASNAVNAARCVPPLLPPTPSLTLLLDPASPIPYQTISTLSSTPTSNPAPSRASLVTA